MLCYRRRATCVAVWRPTRPIASVCAHGPQSVMGRWLAVETPKAGTPDKSQMLFYCFPATGHPASPHKLKPGTGQPDACSPLSPTSVRQLASPRKNFYKRRLLRRAASTKGLARPLRLWARMAFSPSVFPADPFTCYVRLCRFLISLTLAHRWGNIARSVCSEICPTHQATPTGRNTRKMFVQIFGALSLL